MTSDIKRPPGWFVKYRDEELKKDPQLQAEYDAPDHKSEVGEMPFVKADLDMT